MPNYEIEIGENVEPSICPCCGKNSFIGHGFVYKDGDAYAIYYAGWAEEHIEKKISLALAIGKWDDESTSTDRTCFGIEASEGENDILFSFIDPEASPWPKTDLLGEMLSRKDSLKHSFVNEVFLILEQIVRGHPAIRKYLNI
ncbi:hypothetical protein [Methylomonas koyamae]|uniref:Uncharacterized protein n=1 Tax=Methylomonas koyamae TaxID=702114 RepID=A0AA91DD64_9GAMM|nr:hypothetical protein [Methylomonas koyamae]OAI26505.1 hypothetical protein A1356_11250 [Methylomonas koyamae]